MSPAAASSGSSLTERIVLLFLVAATVVLSYVYFRVLPGRGIPPPEPFDISNPMLDAGVGECVILETTSNPGSIACLSVREPAVVLRPPDGPSQLGIFRGLRRGRPYLTCGVRYPPPGKDCDDANARVEIELFDLNGFGMPYSLVVGLESIRPLWVERGGRSLFVYEVQLSQYGPARTWFVYLHPDASVTGAVMRRHTTERHGVHQTFFSESEDCR